MSYLLNKVESEFKDYKIMLERVKELHDKLLYEITSLESEIALISRSPTIKKSIYDYFESNHTPYTKASLMFYIARLKALNSLNEDVLEIAKLVKINHDFSEQFIKDYDVETSK